MKAFKAYKGGKFNNCSFEWQSATECKVTLTDDVNGLQGSFVPQYDENKVMVGATADTGMKPINKSAAPLPPSPELPEGGP